MNGVESENRKEEERVMQIAVDKPLVRLLFQLAPNTISDIDREIMTKSGVKFSPIEDKSHEYLAAFSDIGARKFRVLSRGDFDKLLSLANKVEILSRAYLKGHCDLGEIVNAHERLVKHKKEMFY